ncbi:hypothetical protein NL676_007645 [Syzygium grande]|nr:hypothetical protein NL676_007645 [Syzygium grande]
MDVTNSPLALANIQHENDNRTNIRTSLVSLFRAGELVQEAVHLISSNMAEKVVKMEIKVDLQCRRCCKKIKKILCEIPQVKEEIFDKKQNKVTITVADGSAENIRQKILCKGRCFVQGVEILPEPKPKPKDDKKDDKKDAVTVGGHQCVLMVAGGQPTSADAGGHRCALMVAGGQPTSADVSGHRCARMGVGCQPTSADAGSHRCARMVAGGHPTSADVGGRHRCAGMGVGCQPTSADAGDLVTRGVAIDAIMKMPAYHGPRMVVTVEGRRHAPMPATSAKVPARLCKESFVIFVDVDLLPRTVLSSVPQ